MRAFDHLQIFWQGYREGNFESLFPLLSADCVLTAPDRAAPVIGSEAVQFYFSDVANALKRSDSFPACSVRERHPKDGADVETETDLAHFCLLLRSAEEEDAHTALLIQLNAEEKIDRIVLCDAARIRSRYFWPYVSLCPCMSEEKPFQDAAVLVSESYYAELYLFLDMVGVDFDEYDDTYLPMEAWIRALERWQRFYAFETFDEAFEDTCGIDYKNFTCADQNRLYSLSHSGACIWNNRNHYSYMLEELIEWTNQYKERWSHVRIHGCF